MNHIFCVLFAVLMVLGGCNNPLASFESKPNALGTTNQVVVIADQSVWDGMIGDSIRYYFGSPYPIMPQPEPMFDLKHYTVTEINNQPLRKELRTYFIIGNLSDPDSPTARMIREDLGPEKMRRFEEDPGFYSSVGKDKWARGQLLIYLFGHDEPDVIEKMIKAFPTIAERIHTHDIEQIDAATYLDGESLRLQNTVREKFRVTMKIPGDFKVALNRDNFIWIRRDTREVTSSIAMRQFGYKEESQLTKDGLVTMRDRMGLFIQGSTPGSFMQTNDVDLPVLTYNKELDGHFTVEMRGVWEMTEDYLGGPFVSYAVVRNDSILMIDCFIYAPGKVKRDLVQQLEHVVSSLQLEE